MRRVGIYERISTGRGRRSVSIIVLILVDHFFFFFFYRTGTHYRVPGYMAMKEIYENGPITAMFYMFKDFVSYQTGADLRT